MMAIEKPLYRGAVVSAAIIAKANNMQFQLGLWLTLANIIDDTWSSLARDRPKSASPSRAVSSSSSIVAATSAALGQRVARQVDARLAYVRPKWQYFYMGNRPAGLLQRQGVSRQMHAPPFHDYFARGAMRWLRA